MRADSILHARLLARRAFSLVEMLLAVFILGIGVISIAALFPAGIVLQRQATDDIIGPLVAKNAFATLRSKLSQSDFGGFNDFGLAPSFLDPGASGAQEVAGTIAPMGGAPIPQLNGDWCWMRPGFLFGAANAGTIDIFSAAATREGLSGSAPGGAKASEIAGPIVDSNGNDVHIYGIPYNRQKYPFFSIDPGTWPFIPAIQQQLIEPAITFTQAERSFPQGAANYGASTQYPLAGTYYWDCMFRRNGGKVQVAVFVYRVTAPGGENRPYAVAEFTATTGGGGLPAGAFPGAPTLPPSPAMYRAPNFGTGAIGTSWPNRTNALSGAGNTTAAGYTAPPLPEEIPGTGVAAANSFGTAEQVWDDWQAPGSWWVDNHGTVHRVLMGRVHNNQGPVRLQRPIPIVPRSPVNGVSPLTPALPAAQQANATNGFISAIWFIPRRDRFGNVITPVFAAVEEL